MGQATGRRDVEFSRCFEQEMPRLLRYAERHVGADLAQDIVAETFQIAWRKWDQLPEVKFPWLVGTARKVIGNQIRSLVRRRRLVSRLELFTDMTENTSVDPTERIVAVRRLSSLNESDREALLLVAWDGLTNEAAAGVLGISPATFRKRLSRARAAITAAEESERREVSATLGFEEKS